MSNPCFKSVEDMQAWISGLPTADFASFDAPETLAISVDLNNGFAKKGALYSPRVEALIPKTVRFAKDCKQRSVRLVALTDCHNQTSPEFTGFPPHCVDGTDEPLVVEEIREYVDRIITKNSTNGFYRLMEQGLVEPYRNFIITGCCTDICIFLLAAAIKTWFNEQNTDCRVVVPVSMVDTYDAPGHDAGLLNTVFLCSMLSGGIEVVCDISIQQGK